MHAILLGVLVAFGIRLFAQVARPAFGDSGPPVRAGSDSLRLGSSLTDPPPPGQLIQPEALARALADTTAKRPVVLQVGFRCCSEVCCPWADCPNVRPAFQAARKMGCKDVRVLNLAKNLQHNWVDQGLPVVDGE